MPRAPHSLPATISETVYTSRGTDQSGVKLYNERLVLSLIRSHGSLSKTEIARRTGLSTQASSVIMNQLERDGLLLRREPTRGKVGQPSIPMSLNPEGAFSIGFKFGRRSATFILMDLVGNVRRLQSMTYPYPIPKELERFVESAVAEIPGHLDEDQMTKICGLGIAVPFQMWGWEAETGAPHDVVEAWRGYEIKSEVQKRVPWPVHLCNDATAACAAELAFGNRARYANFLYVYFATFIGGGVVLDGALYPGRAGYAGSFGSILVPDPAEKSAQSLIRRASIYILENRLRSEGKDPAILRRSPAAWNELGATLEDWVEQVADSLSTAVGSAISVIDFEAVVIDGAFPTSVRTAVVQQTREKFKRMEIQGVAPVEIVEGQIGGDASVLGAASLPLLAGFSRDRDLLFRVGA
ncbi:MAG TPA: ROK family transcriptional regulator [Chthoniobacterales bacterium]|nr:ROK family transcriptional regulator [Chthoniobacterales bacterium]